MPVVTNRAVGYDRLYQCLSALEIKFPKTDFTLLHDAIEDAMILKTQDIRDLQDALIELKEYIHNSRNDQADMMEDDVAEVIAERAQKVLDMYTNE